MAASQLLKQKKISRETNNKKLVPIQKKADVDESDESNNLSAASSSPYRFLYRIPAAFLLLMILFAWSSSTTVISGSYAHVCISSRKLSNLYCLSAGTSGNNEAVRFPDFGEENNNDNATSSSSGGGNPVSTTTIMLNSTHLMEEIPYNHAEPVYVAPNIVKETNDQNSANTTAAATTTTIRDANATSNSTSMFINRYIYNKDDEDLMTAAQAVEEQLQVLRSWRSNSSNSSSSGTCDGRGIFVYDLPSKFNKDLMNDDCSNMVPWMNFCEYFTNEAMGEPILKLGKGWYRTHQYSLEPIFHARVLKHPCRVYNVNEAKLFYVPYYGGLDILRWHFKNSTVNVKDMLSLEFMKWLQLQQPWVRNSGKDHLFVLGKISWDFRRRDGELWGTKFLELDQMQNPLKLLIERQPWHVNDIGVPHPTHFHPHSDSDIVEWKSKISQSDRRSLISFAGAARPGAPDNIRSTLIKQCTSVADEGICRFHNCVSGGCDQPESLIELFMESEFCLQPPGDSPTRKSVFDSLISGCIPVLFDPFTAYYQYPWHLPEDHRRYSVYIAKEEVRDMKVNVVERLMKVSLKERKEMRRYIIHELMPRLVYGEPNSELHRFEDAFSVSINNVLDRVVEMDSPL
ncbi:hypothetical protein MKW98_009306 [Papaver atlanticum]|uniref:Exostosin GT47 domain-containing protein n=1 Tax=Papaver atlanticum TaxID=357466 RepID=A0AAD4RZ57_9MAGN|nr:hypothetical protein MKW98_009306 [Papaver atlanticum]